MQGTKFATEAVQNMVVLNHIFSKLYGYNFCSLYPTRNCTDFTLVSSHALPEQCFCSSKIDCIVNIRYMGILCKWLDKAKEL